MPRRARPSIALALFALWAAACSVSVNRGASDEPPVGCTEEARVCDDGSTRVRKGPDCSFDPCPEDGATGGSPPPDGVVCTQDAKQCPDGSYVGRSGPNCEFAPCPGE